MFSNENLDADSAGFAELCEEFQRQIGTLPPPVPSRFTERNRRNARKSTGPNTAAGKAASSRNRLAHGLCSGSLLVAGETEADFEQLHQSLLAAYQPVNPEETLLTSQVAQALWRYNRAQRIESSFLLSGQSQSLQTLNAQGHGGSGLDDLTELEGDGLTIGLFMREVSYKHLERIQRYLTSAERTYHRAVKMLQHAQEKRRNLPQPAAPVVEEPAAPPLKAAAAAATFAFPGESGFVPQNVPSSVNPRPALMRQSGQPRKE